MNITKEQIFDWVARSNRLYGMTDKIDLIHDCIQDLGPKWVGVDNTPTKTCKAWVQIGSVFFIYEYYICPEYENGWWINECGEDVAKLEFTRYQVIEEPEPPK